MVSVKSLSGCFELPNPPTTSYTHSHIITVYTILSQIFKLCYIHNEIIDNNYVQLSRKPEFNKASYNKNVWGLTYESQPLFMWVRQHVQLDSATRST